MKFLDQAKIYVRSGNGGAGIDMPLRHREGEQRAIPRTAPLR